MSNKKGRYLGWIILLLTANLLLVFSKGSTANSSFEDGLFTVADTSQITNVRISSADTKIHLKRTNNSWALNEKYEVDQGFLTILFSIMDQVKIKRTVGQNDIKPDGQVEIKFRKNEALNFDFATDGNRTKTYFFKNEHVYQVEVPGYRENVAGIFQLHTDQWRSRLIMDGSWRTIQHLNMTYATGDDNFTIRFDDDFFLIDQIQTIDTSFVVDYLNQFQALQANEMISKGRFSALDSLLETKPLAVLTIDNIRDEDPSVFNIYPKLDNHSYHLLTKEPGELMVMDQQRVQLILKKRQDFKAKQEDYISH